MDKLNRSGMLAVMEKRDAFYDGVFFVGVKTMKIYCLASCKAKLPLHRNVVFFANRAAALASGYRACRRCKPDTYPHNDPVWLDQCIQHLHCHTDRRIREWELSQLTGVDITTLRRHFKAKLNRAPMAYHRDIRLQKAAEMLLNSASVLRVSEETGFESLSGFVGAFQKRYGVSPGKYAGA